MFILKNFSPPDSRESFYGKFELSFRMEAWKELLFELSLVAIGITLIALLYQNNLLLTIILLLSFLLTLKFWRREDILLFFVGAIIGSVSEIIGTNSGVWRYTNPTFLGIPCWLPLVWGLSVVLIKRIMETLNESRG